MHLPSILAGIFELTTGVHTAPANLLIPCAIISFGGLAVAMQGFLFLKTFRMPFWFYLLYKVTHTVFALLIYLVVLIV